MRKLFVVLVLAIVCELSGVSAAHAQITVLRDGIEYYLTLVGNEDEGYSGSYFSVVGIYPDVEGEVNIPKELAFDLGSGIFPVKWLSTTIGNYNNITAFHAPYIEGVTDGAFAGNTTLKEVDLASVKSIGANMFRDCTSMETVSLSSVQTVGAYAFCGMTSLVTVDMPSVQSLGQGAFSGCTKIESVSFPALLTMSEGVFMRCTALTSLSAPRVTVIPKDAFAYGGQLASIDMPQLKSIGEQAFYFNTNIHDLSFASFGSLIEIGEAAFGFSSIHSIELPNSVTIIDCYCFSSCSNLESVHFTETSNPAASLEFGTSAFSLSTQLTEMEMPQNLKKIDDYCFRRSGINTLTLPEGLESIGDGAFSDCQNISKVALPKSLVSLSDNPWAECRSIESITTDGANPVFESPTGSNVIIDKEKKSVRVACGKSILPPDVQIIGRRAFSGAEIGHLTLPATVQMIESFAFSYSTLPSIDLPHGLKRIEEDAFNGCDELVSLYIPNSVDSIAYGIYSASDPMKAKLESVIIEDGNPYYDSREGCNALIRTAENRIIAAGSKVKIPEGIVKTSLIWGGMNLHYLDIPKSISRIYLDDCPALSCVVCHWADYETISSVVPNMNPNPRHLELHVPEGSAYYYQHSAGWNMFNEYIEDAETFVYDPTNIGGINAADDAVSSAIYNLRGQRISTPQSGEMYIKNGKKFMMK